MIRKATIKDIKEIHKLLTYYGKEDLMIPRPLSELYDHIRDFSMFEDRESNEIKGFCALQFCWEDLAEIRSLAVIPEYKSQKIGTRLVTEAINEAKKFEISKVFTLTYQPKFFEKMGFKKIERSELPLKIWSDCIICVKFPDCDETPMLKIID